jgi:hypothetical protein
VWNANTGCQASFCDSVVVLPAPTVPPAPVTISGNVSFGGISPADFATVYLIAGDTGLLSLTLVDSVNLTPNNMGNYTFANVPAGTYLVKAALRTNSVQYANRVPTYYGNSATWLYAMPVVAPGGATLTGINIPLIAGNNPGGPGFVGGSVLNGANKNLMVNLSPANQLIMLMDAQTREVVAFTRTDFNGQYSLSNLPHGVYYLRLEVMGLQTEEQLIILTDEEDQLTDVDFNDLAGITSRTEASTLQSVALYPNPATERTTLRFTQATSGATELVLLNQLGQVVNQQAQVLAAGAHSLELPVAQLPAGLYLYRLTAADGSTAQGRFIRADR